MRTLPLTRLLTGNTGLGTHKLGENNVNPQSYSPASNISPYLALVVTTPGPTLLPAVTRQPAHLTALVATDERPGAHLTTALVESVSVTVPAVPGARVPTVEDGLTLDIADLILGALVAGNNLQVTTL